MTTFIKCHIVDINHWKCISFELFNLLQGKKSWNQKFSSYYHITESKGVEKEPLKETPREEGIKIKRGLETRNVHINNNKNKSQKYAIVDF